MKSLYLSFVSVLLAAGAGACATTGAPKETAVGALHRFTSGQDGFFTNSHYYDSGEEVVVFGAQFTPKIAKELVEQIKRTTLSPIRYVVITHPNPDKFNGASVFQQEGAKVVASRQTAEAMIAVHAYKKYYFVNIAKMFTEASYPKLPTVDLEFDNALALPLSRGSVNLRELTNSGMSRHHTVALIDGLNAILVGDLVHHKAHAWLEGPIVNGQAVPDLAGWRARLLELKDFDRSAKLTLYGGRGEPTNLHQAVEEQIKYLKVAEDTVRDYVQSVSDPESLTGADAQKHHEAITQKMSEAFPQYALPFMVTYGVYGLVNQLAATTGQE